jgi:hypothetical protein
MASATEIERLSGAFQGRCDDVLAGLVVETGFIIGIRR